MNNNITHAALRDIRFDDATILFPNFAGKESRYNAKGDRNFAIDLGVADDNNEFAKEVSDAGWNVRVATLKRDNQDHYYLPVRVKFHDDGSGPNPLVYRVTELPDGRKRLGRLNENTVDEIDYSDIVRADLIITPSAWEVNGNRGIKAYLKKGYFTLASDDFDGRYADAEYEE